MRQGFLPHNNGELYFELTGDGFPITFIHGFTLDHTMWSPQVEYFSQDYLVLTYDLRGFGKSSAPIGFYSHHEDLYALLSGLGIRKTHLVGLSLGGEIAIDFTLEFPEMIASLTLADSSLGGYKSSVDWNLHGQEVGIEGAKQNWLNHEVFSATRKNLKAMAVLNKIVANYSGWHFVNADKRTKLKPSALERLPEITTPTSILVGEYDLPYFHTINDTLSSKISSSKKSVIENAGHMVNIENPKVFNSSLLDFIHSVGFMSSEGSR